MDSTLEDVPRRLKPTVEMLFKNCFNDQRIRSAWLEGSLAQGSADDWSDIDLHLVVRETENFAAIDWLESQVHLVLADAIPGLPSSFICLTSSWIHIDVNVHSSETQLTSGESRRVLLARDALIQDIISAPSPRGQAFFPAQDVQIFLYFLGKTIASVHRGDLIALSQTTAMMRDRLLVNLLLAENGIQSGTLNKRIGQHLSDEQVHCLQEIPVFGFSELSIRDAQQKLAAVYLARARKLAEECGAAWPIELEQATKNLWHRELMMSW
ncbi:MULTISPECIES: aminoglycoside 6-adenylyltransferase [Arthrobacter]|uniref:Nucleotidyltransferase domain-containing protein n=1 Tax=Arthrobacter terricola TaxID=2547396 RepID=A0A4R5KCI1_9MICC|nr:MULTISPECIES: aminoglycoside 6-adenylyltransferase [Arthrobacter]MBT8162558.1 aminoglycoside 6-adenylyltransferase [Arthrobacter sp. GN70]TDF92883.1 hypothetical protein E1809_17140 [Arthrobacter terricola]